jgi:hypothetical protein
MLQDVDCFGLAGAVVSVYDQSFVHNCIISLCPKYILWRSLSKDHEFWSLEGIIWMYEIIHHGW